MVGAILTGIFFGIAFIAGIVLTVIGCFQESWAFKGPGAGLIVVMFFLLLFIPGSFHQVDTGEVAVVKHLGQAQEEEVTPGISFKFWMTYSYVKYPTTVQTISISTPSFSSDNQTMDIDLSVFYQIDGTKADKILSVYGGLGGLETKIERIAEEELKNVLSSYRAEDVIANRGKVISQIQEAIDKRVDPETFYADITMVNLTNIDFTDEFEKSVEDKVIAEQRAKQAEYEQKQKVIEAEAQLQVAKLEAEAALARAEGNAAAQKVIAAAEAYATQIKIVELARAMGYKITAEEVYTEELVKNETTGETEPKKVLSGYEYTIDWSKYADGSKVSETDTGKDMVLKYLQYLEYLSKWNGELPDVVAGDADLSMFIPSK